MTNEPTKEEIAAMKDGDTLLAIKLLRERLHLGFLEANGIVERWMIERPWERE